MSFIERTLEETVSEQDASDSRSYLEAALECESIANEIDATAQQLELYDLQQQELTEATVSFESYLESVESQQDFDIEQYNLVVGSIFGSSIEQASLEADKKSVAKRAWETLKELWAKVVDALSRAKEWVLEFFRKLWHGVDRMKKRIEKLQKQLDEKEGKVEKQQDQVQLTNANKLVLEGNEVSSDDLYQGIYNIEQYLYPRLEATSNLAQQTLLILGKTDEQTIFNPGKLVEQLQKAQDDVEGNIWANVDVDRSNNKTQLVDRKLKLPGRKQFVVPVKRVFVSANLNTPNLVLPKKLGEGLMGAPILRNADDKKINQDQIEAMSVDQLSQLLGQIQSVLTRIETARERREEAMKYREDAIEQVNSLYEKLNRERPEDQFKNRLITQSLRNIVKILQEDYLSSIAKIDAYTFGYIRSLLKNAERHVENLYTGGGGQGSEPEQKGGMPATT